jgi:predicted anti-sigma-YlaC factor YlaD
MKKDQFERWLRNIYRTQEEEISCSECFDLVSRFVELEVSGEDPVRQMPEVKHHLEQCAVCREEYEALRDLRRLEEQDGLPPLDDLIP